MTLVTLSGLATLVEKLHGRAALLVVDNCEHLLSEAASVVDALARGCSRLRWLMTS